MMTKPDAKKIEQKFKNIFGTVLTNVAPASNYRGETQNNRAILQKLTCNDGEQYTLVSAEAIRSRLREMLRDDSNVKLNRSRVINPYATGQKAPKRKRGKDGEGDEAEPEQKDQITVKFEALPDRKQFADDLLFGFLMIDDKKKAELKENNGEKQGDSILRVNYAVSLDPFPRYNTYTMHQSPKASDDSAYKNAKKSALIEREVHVTAFQFPFGLNLNDLRHTPDWKDASPEDKKEKMRWVALLLRAICELNGVAGNHARTMYPFAPVSIVMRLTTRRAPEFDLYGFKPKQNGNDGESQAELIESLRLGELSPSDFYIGGRIVKVNPALKAALAERKKRDLQSSANGESKEPHSDPEIGHLINVNLFDTSRAAIEAVIVAADLDEKEVG